MTNLSVNHRISQRLPLEESKSSHVMTGVIGSLPEAGRNGVRFLFLADENTGDMPSKIYVTWYKSRDGAGGWATDVPQLRAGERW